MAAGECVKVFLCRSADLVEGGEGVAFDLLYCGRPERGFAIRYGKQVYAYLNRCSHVPIELDYRSNRFFDSTGRWLMCSTHGARFLPETGVCVGGPGRGGLVKIVVDEADGQVHWHTSRYLKPLEFANE